MYRLEEDGERQEKLKTLEVDDVLTGSGLTDAQELYSREAHRKRALEMYKHSSQPTAIVTSPTAASISPAAASTSPTSISPEGSHSFKQQTNMYRASPDNFISATRQTGMAKSASNPESPFSLIMETIQLRQPKTAEINVKETPKSSSNDEARFKHKISVSGSYIPPPPERLSFARRSGKFHPSTAGMDLHSDATHTMPPVPHLRILQDGEKTDLNF